MNETFDAYGRLVQLLGLTSLDPGKFGRAYLDIPTEIVTDGDVEIWEIFNLTGDTHPIHFHLVNVQVLNREAFTTAPYTAGRRSRLREAHVRPTRRNSAGRKQ